MQQRVRQIARLVSTRLEATIAPAMPATRATGMFAQMSTNARLERTHVLPTRLCVPTPMAALHAHAMQASLDQAPLALMWTNVC